MIYNTTNIVAQKLSGNPKLVTVLRNNDLFSYLPPSHHIIKKIQMAPYETVDAQQCTFLAVGDPLDNNVATKVQKCSWKEGLQYYINITLAQPNIAFAANKACEFVYYILPYLYASYHGEGNFKIHHCYYLLCTPSVPNSNYKSF